jgi:hypothetical protein
MKDKSWLLKQALDAEFTSAPLEILDQSVSPKLVIMEFI